MEGLEGGLILQSGRSMGTNIEYENVSLQIISKELSSSNRDEIIEDIVAIIRWKNRACA